ncbi:MAG: hypothetical protein ACREC0_00470 [Methylocella sp.]
MDEDDAALARQIEAKEAAWRSENALEALGRLLPRHVKRVLLDQAMVDDLMRDERGLAANAPAATGAALGKALDHYLRGESARRGARVGSGGSARSRVDFA